MEVSEKSSKLDHRLLGLWEFGDIAALFVPGFGNIPAFLWNHIIVGMVLVVTGVWAARTNDAGTAQTLSWNAVVAGIWQIIGILICDVLSLPLGRGTILSSA